MAGQLFIHADLSEADPQTNIFKKSTGGNFNYDTYDKRDEYYKGIGTLYRASPNFQRGYGLKAGGFNNLKKRGTGVGSFFQSLWRVAFPMIKTGAKKLGSTALDVATSVASDALQGKNIKESAKEHLTTKGTALLSDIKKQGVDILKNINPAISGIINKSDQPTIQPVSQLPTTLAAPSPQKSFRRLSRKRVPSSKVKYTPPRKKSSNYPALKYLN
jgi:hypothetical protein